MKKKITEISSGDEFYDEEMAAIEMDVVEKSSIIESAPLVPQTKPKNAVYS